MLPIIKYAAEEIPLVFDFSARLGALAPGAKITEVLELSVSPSDDEDDLDIGTISEAILDSVGQLAVQVRAIKGRAIQKVYSARCKAAVEHAGASYPLIVELFVNVRE